MIRITFSNNYLAHHGVKGQQWGKRNGPPYPLDSDAKEKFKEQKKINAEKIREAKEEYRFQKKMAKIKVKTEQVKMLPKQVASGTKLTKQEKRNLNAIEGKNIFGKVDNRKIRNMSNEELQKAIDRLTLEKKYLELVDELNGNKKNKDKKGTSFAVDVGKKAVDTMVQGAARDVGTKILSQKIANAVNTRNSDNKDWDKVIFNNGKKEKEKDKKDDD